MYIRANNGSFYIQRKAVEIMASRIQGITVEIGGDTTKLLFLFIPLGSDGVVSLKS